MTSATGYKLQERRDTESWTEYDEGTATSKALSDKESGAWEYQVQACNGAVCSGWSDSLLVSVAPPGTLTIEPSPSLDGDYTVSWGAPRCFGVGGFIPQICYVLQERVDGSEEWTDVPGVATLATSYPFSAKTNGTYYYQLVIGVGGTVVVAGPESVEVERVPTASISWNPSTVDYGGTSTLSWSSTDVTGCTLDGTDRGTSGSREQTNLTQTQTSELSCTTADEKTVTDSATLTVEPLPGITIEPLLSTDGSYTVSWNAPLCISRPGVQGRICRVLEERAGDDVTASWETVMDVSGTSRAFRDKLNGTYYYRLMLRTRPVAGPESVEVDRVPTASISWNPSTVDYGGTSTLSWSAADVTGCTVDRTDRGTSGSREQANLTQTQTSEFTCTAADDSEVSDSATLHVRPPAPAAPAATPEEPDAGGNYTVNWVAVAHSTYYELQERSGTDEWMTYTYEKDSGQYAEGENMNKEFIKQASGDWKYRVRACNAKEPEVCSDWSEILAVTVPETELPSAMVSWDPATVDYGGTSTLSWSAADVTGCTLDGTDRGTSGSLEQTNLTQTQTSELSCTTTNETVTASATLHVRPPVPASPAASPEEPDAGETYTVNWVAVAHSTYYELQERSGTDEWMTYTYEKDSGQYAEGENMNKEFIKQASGDWKYRVRACNAKEPEVCSDWSETLAVTVPEIGAPDTPDAPMLTPGDGKLDVTWDTPADNGSPLTGYAVRSKQHDSDEDWDEQELVDTETSTEIIDLTNGAEYAVQVQAVNAEGDSPWSESAFGTPLSTLTVPTGLTGPAGSTGTHTISWNPVTGAERYELRARLDAGRWTVHNTGEETRKAFTALGYGDWQYEVQACNGEQCSGWSAGLTVVVGPGTVPKPPAPIVTAPGSVVSDPEQKAMDKVGTLAGEFRVAESGAATYRIALPLPAGTAGATPSLGLQYNSQRGNGLLGIGWTLDGLSAISRCRQTFAQDGKAQPLTFMDKDRFCLDGQRLLLTDDSPTQTYGAPNSKYKTEIDGFLTVTAKDGSAGQPDYFEVVRKDGSVSRYGAKGASAAEQRVYNPGGAVVDKVLTWALQVVRDSVGNRIVYSYTADEQGHRISKISYAYGSGNTARAEVDFTYEGRQDDTVGYLAGYKLQSTQRLEEITVHSAGSTGGLVALRKYKLRYRSIATNATDVLSRLAGISECVGTSSVCLPETRFTWSLPETLFKTTAASTLALNSDGWGPVDFSPADINGDGLTDLVWTETNNDKHRIQYALADRGTGRLQMTQFTNNQFRLEYNDDYGRSNYGDNLRVHTEVVDYNADGRLDILVYSEGTDRTELHLAVPQSEGGWRLAGRGEFLFNGRYRYADLDSDGLLDAYKLVELPPVPPLTGVWNSPGYQLEVRYLKRDMSQTETSDRYYAYTEPLSLSIDFSSRLVETEFERSWRYLRRADVQLADVDGDGRADLVAWGYDANVGLGPFANAGARLRRLEVFRQSVEEVVSGDSAQRVIRFVRYGGVDGVPVAGTTYAAKGVRAVDLNQDGLSDLVYFVGRWYRKSSDNYQWTGDWQYRLSTGAGFTDAVTLLDVADNAQAPMSPSLHDDNGDGYPDFLWHDVPTRQVKVKRWSPEHGAFETGETRVRSASGKDDETYFTLDVNGDGNGDLLHVPESSGGAERLKVYRHNTAGRPHLIKAITNGLGAETEVRYESLSATKSYVRIAQLHSTPEEEICFDWAPGPGVTWTGLQGGEYCRTVESALEDADAFYEALNDPWADPPDPADPLTGSLTNSLTETVGDTPVLELMGPLYVVTRVESSAPTGSDAGAMSGIDYMYQQGKIQAAGRGLLGFRTLTTVDLQTGVSTKTTYRQDFPYIGLPLRTEVKTASGKLLRSAQNTWKLKGYQSAWNARTAGSGVHAETGSARLGPLQPYLETSVEAVYDLPATVNGALTAGALLSTVTTATEVDGYGNPTNITVTTEDHANNKRFRQETVNRYGSANDDWGKQFGRVRRTEVTRRRDEANDGVYEASALRTAAFSYYTTKTLRGLLRTETRAPFAARLKHKTTYSYDRFGNRVGARVRAAAGATAAPRATRCKNDTVVYDEYGRYVVEEKDCLERLRQRLGGYNAYGQPAWSARLIAQDGAAVRTAYSYTAGGRLYFTRDATGAYTGTRQADCGSGCPAGAAYYTETRQAGGGVRRDYRDVLAREVRRAVQGFDGRWINTDTEYDHLGRASRRSEPYYAGESAYWTTYQYDVLGRVTRTTLPDYVPGSGGVDSVVTVRYAGLATTTTNGKGQRRVQTRTALGEVLRTADHAGTTVAHRYDVWGQVVHTTTTGTGVSPVVVAMGYDGRGRRAWLDDPDRGRWEYRYNGFDELVRQTGCSGECPGAGV